MVTAAPPPGWTVTLEDRPRSALDVEAGAGSAFVEPQHWVVRDPDGIRPAQAEWPSDWHDHAVRYAWSLAARQAGVDDPWPAWSPSPANPSVLERRARPETIPVERWTGRPHERPGFCLPRPHQVKVLTVGIAPWGMGDVPRVQVPLRELDREHWPNGLRLVLGMTAKQGAPVLADGWSYRVTRAVGTVERTAPRRWVAVESVALRLRGAGTGAVVVWLRDVVWLKHPRRHKPKPAEWSAEWCKVWPLTPDGRPASTPVNVTSAELKAMIRKGPPED